MTDSNQRTNQVKLPIYNYKEIILKHIQNQSALIISGLTGCGKSTQVPQFLLDHYPNSITAVCEPRRLASTSLALRVCQQRRCKIGHQIGYQIGLESKRSESTRITYMTYGILIQQLLFKQELDYDFIILDEVHERSLQMDFAFVILKKLINKSRMQENDGNGEVCKEKQAGKERQACKGRQGSQRLEQKEKKRVKRRDLKLIIMSATLNSDQFQKYFSVHKKTGLIIEPQVVISHIQQKDQQKGNKRGSRQERRRGNIEIQKYVEPKKQVVRNYNNIEDYKEGCCVFINQKSIYQVNEYFLDDFLPYFQIKPPNKNYQYKEEVRLQEKHYDWGVKLIEKLIRDIEYSNLHQAQQKSQKPSSFAGDILVFLPGLIEINRMKQILIKQNKQYLEKIIQVHSLFSEELYQKLFKSKIKNKIILATNIGQSSITLPNCKAVIDYCLNRKAVKNTKQGISRFSTTVASLSNLIQRKGRVGRVSDGVVYRMITKEQFKTLQEFDIPQIKCVSLQMAILKTKKLESTSKSRIFQDIYDIFLNVLEHPQINAIQSAIESLIHQDALQYIEEDQGFIKKQEQQKGKQKRKINCGKKYDGKKLKITKVGEFMVSMPCDLSVSKLILMGIKIGISSVIIDIAAIILSTKSFFCHQERRYNIEEFMHSLIGYDGGQSNDYLLRQRLFDHWRSKYYVPYRNKHRKELDEKSRKQDKKQMETSFRIFDFGEEIEFDQNYRIVDRFVRKRESEDQIDFCCNRGVYPNFMRQLLRLSETLKIRIEMMGVQKSKLNSYQPQAELILICLMYAFPDVICQVTFQTKKKQRYTIDNSSPFKNKIFVPLVQGFTQQELQAYLNPYKQYEYKKYQNSLMIMAPDHILKKFLLPKNYLKANSQNCSLLYKHCKLSKIKYNYQYNIYQEFRNITVLNQSINKQILISSDLLINNRIQSQYLISHNLIESKGRYMVGANAIISNFLLVLISMIVKKHIGLRLHSSEQFFSHIQINQKTYQIPVILTETQLSIINKLRDLSKRKKQEEISSYKQQFDKNQLIILSNLFKLQNKKPMEQDLEQLFQEQQQKIIQNEMGYKPCSQEMAKQNPKDVWISIQKAQNKIKKPRHKPYYERYNIWKRSIYEESQKLYKLYSTKEAILICGHCYHDKKMIQIAQASSYQFKRNHLKLNKYSGSWICPQAKALQIQQIDRAGLKICCSQNHHIGISVEQQKAEIDLQKMFLYVPFNNIYLLKEFKSVQQYQSIVELAKIKGVNELLQKQKQFSKYECKICFTREYYKVEFDRQENEERRRERSVTYTTDKLWNKIINHMVSSKHMSCRERLRNSIDWKR